MRFSHVFAATAVLLTTPALAQSADAPMPDPKAVGDHWTLAAGAGYTPDYVGSNDYTFIPVAAVRGKIGSVSIFSQSSYLYADFFPRGDGIDLDAGPIVGVRLNRRKHVDDPVVDRLPELKTAFEAGGFVGVSLHNLTNPYDTLQFRVDVVHDFANAHESTVISPYVTFSTPLSRKTYASASVGADFVSDKFADYYFSISPEDAAVSGLSPFKASGGMKNWGASLLVNQSLTGDLMGGLSIFGTASYSRLQGDFKRSPIVSDRGSANQWLLATGLAYTF